MEHYLQTRNWLLLMGSELPAGGAVRIQSDGSLAAALQRAANAELRQCDAEVACSLQHEECTAAFAETSASQPELDAELAHRLQEEEFSKEPTAVRSLPFSNGPCRCPCPCPLPPCPLQLLTRAAHPIHPTQPHPPALCRPSRVRPGRRRTSPPARPAPPRARARAAPAPLLPRDPAARCGRGVGADGTAGPAGGVPGGAAAAAAAGHSGAVALWRWRAGIT